MALYPPSPLYSEYNYGGTDVCRADESLYLDESWKHQPDYSCSDSNDSSVPSHSPNLIEMNTVTGSSFPITGTNFTFANQQEDSYSWQTKHPQTWDQCDVSRWIQHLVDSQQLATTVHWGALFGDVDGTQLCAMSMDEFQAREPTYGYDLYLAFQQGIHQPAMHYQQTYVYNQPEMVNNYDGTDNMTSLERYINIVSFDQDDKFTSLPNIASFTTKPDSVPAPPRSAVPLVVPKDEPADSDSDTLSSPPSSPSPSEDCVVPTKTTNRRGRGKGKLWEFVLNLLLDSKTNPEIIRWEDRQNGVFRIVRSDQVAKLWGIRKSNPSMTYEKMSRAMRYYYRKNILERIDGRRLVYKFGPNSRGWQLD